MFLASRWEYPVSMRQLALLSLVGLLPCQPVMADIKSQSRLERCGISAEQDRSGKVVFFNKGKSKNTIVEKTLQNFSRIEFRVGHKYEKPGVALQNNNKFGVSAVALGFTENGTIQSCSSDPKKYDAVFLCRSIVPGVGIGAGEYGLLDCNVTAKAGSGRDFCIIGFTPEFESAGLGLAVAMDSLGMCD